MAGDPAQVIVRKVDVQKLRRFHEVHFPGQQVPDIVAGEDTVQLDPINERHVEIEEEDDGLGYYEDGTKRNLTDTQINIFRHSELRRLLLEKRVEAEIVAADECSTPARDGTKLSDTNSRTQERVEEEQDGSGKSDAQAGQVKDKRHLGNALERSSGDVLLDQTE